MSNLYTIVYTGTLQEGVSRADAIDNVSNLLGLSVERAERFVSHSKLITVKKNVQYDLAKKYENKLVKAGLRVEIIRDTRAVTTLGLPKRNEVKRNTSVPSTRETTGVTRHKELPKSKRTSMAKKTQGTREVRYVKAWLINFVLAVSVAFAAGAILGFILGIILIVTGFEKETVSLLSGLIGFPLGLFSSFYFYKWSIKKYIIPQMIQG